MKHSRFQSQSPLRAVLLLAAVLSLSLFLLLPGCGGDSGPETLDRAPDATTLKDRAAGAAGNVPPAGATSYTFAVCGDNRTAGILNGVMDRIIDSAKSRGAAFIVNTGDVTEDGSREELEYYKAYTELSGITFYTVPGNHDVGSGGVSQAYEEVIGPYYYSFDYAGDHFVVLDNADDRTGIWEEQMQWYAADLQAGRDSTNTFVFAHIPVADIDLPSAHATGEKGPAGLESGNRMVSLTRDYPNARNMFFGHIHAYLAYSLDGIDAYVTGGGGAPLYFPEGSGGYFHYLLVKVDGSRVEVEVVRV